MVAVVESGDPVAQDLVLIDLRTAQRRVIYRVEGSDLKGPRFLWLSDLRASLLAFVEAVDVTSDVPAKLRWRVMTVDLGRADAPTVIDEMPGSLIAAPHIPVIWPEPRTNGRDVAWRRSTGQTDDGAIMLRASGAGDVAVARPARDLAFDLDDAGRVLLTRPSPTNGVAAEVYLFESGRTRLLSTRSTEFASARFAGVKVIWPFDPPPFRGSGAERVEIIDPATLVRSQITETGCAFTGADNDFSVFSCSTTTQVVRLDTGVSQTFTWKRQVRSLSKGAIVSTELFVPRPTTWFITRPVF